VGDDERVILAGNVSTIAKPLAIGLAALNVMEYLVVTP
jgi:hypothetical protein